MDQSPSKVQEVAREAKDKAQQTAQQLKQEGKQQLESGKQGAAEKADQLADAVNRASDELHQQQEHGLADYASQVAAGISRFADTLRHRSIDELISETETLARRNPTVFFLGSIGVGLALSRFLKASPSHAGGEVRTEGADLEVTYDTGAEWQPSQAAQSLHEAASSNSPLGGTYP
jgi:uncharacterized phage infection (PIP) family protein YhgE